MRTHVISFEASDGFYRISPNSVEDSIRILCNSADALRQQSKRVQAVSLEKLIDTREADEIEAITTFLSDTESVLMYYPGAPDGEQLTSLGDRTANGSFEAFYEQNYPFSRKYVVPRHAAIETIRSWLESGILNGPILWTSELFDATAG
jgi:hypothetical protein